MSCTLLLAAPLLCAAAPSTLRVRLEQCASRGHAGLPSVLLLAEDDKGPAGSCAIAALRVCADGFVDAAAVARPFLSALYVEPRCRRRGVGQRLVSEAETVARGWGYGSLCLHVHERNTAGMRLYEKLGYHGTWAGAFSRIDTNNDGKLQKNEVRVEANPCARLLCWPRGKSAHRCWRFCSRIGSMCQAENSTICGMRPHSTVKTRMLSPKQSSRRSPPLRTPTPATLA